jgi:hypothetical protein
MILLGYFVLLSRRGLINFPGTYILQACTHKIWPADHPVIQNLMCQFGHYDAGLAIILC